MTKAEANVIVPMHECWSAATHVAKSLFTPLSVDAFGHSFAFATKPAPALYDHARKVVATLGGVMAAQLRIERDWVEYLRRTGRPETTAEPEYVIGRIAEACAVTGTYRVWACCDEADLLHEPHELKRIAEAVGVELLFKSDLRDDTAYPDSRLVRSALDFTVALLANGYVGLSQSTFSRWVWLYASLGLASDNQFLYDAPAGIMAAGLAKRRDVSSLTLRKPMQFAPGSR